MTKEAKYNGEKMVSSNGAGKTGMAIYNDNEIRTPSHHINSKLFEDLNIRCENHINQEENMGRILNYKS